MAVSGMIYLKRFSRQPFLTAPAAAIAALLLGCPARGAAPIAPPASAPAIQIRATETLLYKIPPETKIADTLVSPDGGSVACVERRGDRASTAKFTVVVNGVRGPEQEWVVGQSLRFSPDGKRFGYLTHGNSLMTVVIDAVGPRSAAVTGKGYFAAGPLVFSPDGKRYAHPARREAEGKPCMVVDGAEGEPCDMVDGIGTPLNEDGRTETFFSSDSKRLAYRAVRSGKQCFLIDGVPGAPFDSVDGFLFSLDSQRQAYRGRIGKQFFLVIDGKVQPAYDAIDRLTFSPDSRRLAYQATKNGKQMLIVEDKPYRPYDRVGDIAFSPDSRRIAMTTRTDNQWRAIVDGKEAAPYPVTGVLAFSPDSKRLAYAAGVKERQLMVIDGAEGPLFDAVGGITFSPDSTRFAYGAAVGSERLLIIDGTRFAPAGLFSFSPDSRHVAHAVPRGANWTIAVDRVPATLVPPGAAPAELTYDGFPFGSRFVFDSPTTAHVIAGRDLQLLRVDLRIEP